MIPFSRDLGIFKLFLFPGNFFTSWKIPGFRNIITASAILFIDSLVETCTSTIYLVATRMIGTTGGIVGIFDSTVLQELETTISENIRCEGDREICKLLHNCQKIIPLASIESEGSNDHRRFLKPH